MIAPPGAKSPDEPVDIPYININGDDIAGKLAAALGAEHLIFLTDVDGIRDAEGNLLEKLSTDEVKSLIDSGVINQGMIPKSEAALVAAEKHCTVQIVDGRKSHALVDAIECKAIGTTIC